MVFNWRGNVSAFPATSKQAQLHRITRKGVYTRLHLLNNIECNDG